MTLTMYGIKNCDTIKKARDWLAAHGVVFDFHDYKAKGADAALLASISTRPMLPYSVGSVTVPSA